MRNVLRTKKFFKDIGIRLSNKTNNIIDKKLSFVLSYEV